MGSSNKLLVSVIIPTYNRAKIVGRAIRSVLYQTYGNLELIIVDDCSADNTEELIKSFTDRRIRYVQHPNNLGASAARNTGIRVAKGQFIAFLDSDDKWLPNKLEYQMAVFHQDKENRLGLVLCEVAYPQKKITMKPEADQLTFNGIMGKGAVGTPSFLLKRHNTESELYFDENLKALQDWDFILRISRITDIGYVKAVLVQAYDDDTNRVYSPHNCINARNYLIQKYVDDFRSRPHVLSYFHYQIALDYYSLSQMNCMRHSLIAAIKACPLNLRCYLDYLISLFGYRGFNIYRISKKTLRQILSRIKIL